MRRALLALAVALALLAAAFLAWWWWTLPPSAPTTDLVAAATAPPGADGLLVLASPLRTARWLTGHVQAAALLGAAAPNAIDALARMRPVLAALATDARGEITLWWEGTEVGAHARVGRRDASALHQVAALAGAGWRETPGRRDESTVEIASSTTMLGPPLESPPLPALGERRLAALARVGTRWWRVVATRRRLIATTGVAPGGPPAAPPTSSITAGDLGALAALLAPSAARWHGPGAVVFARDRGWGLELPEARLPEGVRALLRLGGSEAEDGAERWKGALGDVWTRPGQGVVLASSRAMLETLPPSPPLGDQGFVRVDDLLWAAQRLARAARELPGMERRTEALQRLARRAPGLRLVAWRLAENGGRVTLQW